MHESAGSLKVYFYVIGAIGAVTALIGVVWRFSVVSALSGVVGLAVSAAYVHAGKNMSRFLVESPWRLQRVVLASVVVTALSVFTGVLQGAVYSASVVSGVLVAWYLSTSIKEVSADSRAEADRNLRDGQFT